MSSGPWIATVFVLLWSTGFIGAKLGLPHAEPMTFLAVRFGIVAVLLAAWVQVAGAPWPNWRQAGQQAGIGMLIHSLYLGGVFVAIDWGLEAGVSALIVGLQPIVMAVIAMVLLSERMAARQWLGMALGIAGVALIVVRKLGDGLGSPATVVACCVGLLAISLGAILQKRLSGAPMRAGNAVQFAAAALACALVALVWEDRRIEWAPGFIVALVWSILPLSIGAVTLLYVLTRRGAAAKVASLFFLVPPCTALIAWPLFGEVLGWVEIAGMGLTAIGVLLVNRPAVTQRPASPR